VLAATIAVSADQPTRLQLKKGAARISIKGNVGGEQHDTYSVELRSGQTIRVSVSATVGKVNLSVCESGDYAEAEPVQFGKRSGDGKSWEGLIPSTKVYYLYVTAYPEAEYRLILEAR
jgi:hypothetical protein